MDAFPSDIRFRKSWRSYQQRVLDELKDHLDDNHLHIIAAPGSGKTVLGKNKDPAEYFRKMWARHVGPTDLVYTRTPEVRRFLLKARTHSMSRSFQSRAERLKSWQ